MARKPSEIIEALFLKRGLTLEQQEHILKPDFERDTHDGNLMKGMKVAVSRVAHAIVNQEQIIVFGDYDADGIPATALMVRCLKYLGALVSPLIPARSDGYGLTDIAVSTILDAKPKVVITVDNGTVAQKEVATIAKNADVIIIDHHEPQEGHLAIDALAILNPKQEDCEYPFKDMCACGLVWKFLVCLYEELGKPWDILKWELDLVALSTVADMVPLVDENRTLVIYGLKVMAKTRNLGLQALADVAGIDLKSVNVGDIGFKIAPRINAPSRMHLEVVNGDNAALTLLTTEDGKQAHELAEYLHHQNAERQALVEAHLVEAYSQAEKYKDDKALIVYHGDWSTGVIGLVASKLLDRYHRPVIVLAPEGHEIKGSVRSLGDVVALDLLDSGSGFLTRYGGHAKAAGLTMQKSTSIDDFREAVLAAPCLKQGTLEEIMASSGRDADLTITLQEASLELAEVLQTLAPFGLGFAAPRFQTCAHISSPRTVGKEKQHLSCFLEEHGIKRKAIGFQYGSLSVDDQATYVVDYSLEIEHWNDVSAPSCVIKNIKMSPDSGLT